VVDDYGGNSLCSDNWTWLVYISTRCMVSIDLVLVYGFRTSSFEW